MYNTYMMRRLIRIVITPLRRCYRQRYRYRYLYHYRYRICCHVTFCTLLVISVSIMKGAPEKYFTCHLPHATPHAHALTDIHTELLAFVQHIHTFTHSFMRSFATLTFIQSLALFTLSCPIPRAPCPVPHCCIARLP